MSKSIYFSHGHCGILDEKISRSFPNAAQPSWIRRLTSFSKYITHLRFADDIVVMAETLEDLGTMLDGLSRASQQVGLKMNMDKTKIMSNVRVAPTPLKVGDSALEVVDEYVYLGQTVQLGKSNFEKDVIVRSI
ncbi:hypothetical protein ABMA28_006035 [Loxostege sticticalis]|uniref:Reverse transcriptase domain-containing protein n=1 Tax=Loxostege sticticalis TaxID=481309 RepID=A0ABD0SJS3_LOXSC